MRRRTVLSSSCWSRLCLLLVLLWPSDRIATRRHLSSTSTTSATSWSISSFATAEDAVDGTTAAHDAGNNSNKVLNVRETEAPTLNQILVRAGKRGLGGGMHGAMAGAVQVITLMWLRTVINYQARYGASFSSAISVLLQDGGIRRLYQGVGFALIQAPLARFVATAANDGVNSLLVSLEWTKHWGPGRTTIVASAIVGLWRMMLMPIDTAKTVLQVDGQEGFRNLVRRVKMGKFSVLYQGAIANAVSAIVGHYPWFVTFNVLSSSDVIRQFLPIALIRNACIGLMASIVSDTTVNALRVIKTTKQSLGAKHAVSYAEAVRIVLAADGWRGLFGRGLRTRIWCNALQSIVFTIIWKGLSEKLQPNEE